MSASKSSTTNKNSSSTATNSADAPTTGNKQKSVYTKTRERIVPGMKILFVLIK